MAGNPFSNLSKGQKVAVGCGGAVVVFLVYRSYSKAKAAAGSSSAGASDGQSGIDPATGYPYGSAEDTAALAAQSGSIDPATGYPYGSPEDEAAVAAQSGVATGAGDGYDPAAGYYNSVPAGTQPATNAAWSQYVEQQLSAIGYDPQTIAAAVGAYLAQLPLTSDQASLIQTALAECGPPPQGSYSIITQGSSAPASGGSTPGKRWYINEQHGRGQVAVPGPAEPLGRWGWRREDSRLLGSRGWPAGSGPIVLHGRLRPDQRCADLEEHRQRDEHDSHDPERHDRIHRSLGQRRPGCTPARGPVKATAGK